MTFGSKRGAWCVGLHLAILLVGCGGGGDPEGVPGAADVPEERPVRTVVTAILEPTTLRDAVTVSAEVAPWASVTVAAEGSGRVVELGVEAGDSVRSGQVVARLDADEARARLAQAEAQQEEAEAAAQQAERDHFRGEQMAATSDIAQGELDQLTLARRTAGARLASATATLDLARQALADTEIRAPFAGVVSERHVEVGTWLAPGAPVLRLLDAQQLKIRGALSQRDRARLNLGLEGVVRAEALPGAVWRGPLRLLGQEADPRTGTYRVEVEIAEPRAADGRRLLAGMQTTLSVEVGSRQTLAVPRSALVEAADGSVVFVREAGVARRITPTLGQAFGDHFEVLDGLTAGQEVIVLGQHVLRDGDRVEPAE